MKIIVLQNQSILDIATQYTGSGENAIAILFANNKVDTTISVGEILTIPITLYSVKSDAFYKSNNMPVGCLAIALNDEEYEPELPAEEVNVSINSLMYQVAKANTTLNIPLLNTINGKVAISLSGQKVTVKDIEINAYYLGAYLGTKYIPVAKDVAFDLMDITIPLPPISGPPPVYTGGDVTIRINGQYLKSIEAPADVNIPLVNSEDTELTYTKTGQKIILADSTMNIYLNETLLRAIEIPISSHETINFQ